MKRESTIENQRRRANLEDALLFLARGQGKVICAESASGKRLTGHAALRAVMAKKGDAWVCKALAKPKIAKALKALANLYQPPKRRIQ